MQSDNVRVLVIRGGGGGGGGNACIFTLPTTSFSCTFTLLFSLLSHTLFITQCHAFIASSYNMEDLVMGSLSGQTETP